LNAFLSSKFNILSALYNFTVHEKTSELICALVLGEALEHTSDKIRPTKPWSIDT